jgi:hypothetical protein
MLPWTAIVTWAVGVPAGVVTMGAVGASAIAGLSVSKIWKLDLTKRQRLLLLGAVSLITVVVFLSLWWKPRSPEAIGVSAGLLTAVVLLLRPAHSALRPDLAGRWLQFMMIASYFAGAFLAGEFSRFATEATALLWARSYLLVGVVGSVGTIWYQELSNGPDPVMGDRTDDPAARFFDGQSAFLPVSLGLALLAVAAYGLLVLPVYEGPGWVIYAATAAAGFFVLKRTFSG